MRLVVLGMHRSGASALTGLLHLMGAYIGPEQMNMGASSGQPTGIGERSDVAALNDGLLKSIGCDWDRVNKLNLEELSQRAIDEFRKRAAALVSELDAHEPWVIKEPGLSLVFPLWDSIIRDCICIHVFRNPIEVARSVNARDGTPITVGIALWEKYTREALFASKDKLNLFVSHQELMVQPHAVARGLIEQLTRHGLSGLIIPSSEKIADLIDSTLYTVRDTEDDCAQVLNVQQDRLFRSLVDRSLDQEAVHRKVSRGCSLVLQAFEDRSYTGRSELAGTIDDLDRETASAPDMSDGISNRSSRVQLELGMQRKQGDEELYEVQQEHEAVYARFQRELQKTREDKEIAYREYKEIEQQALARRHDYNVIHGILIRLVRGVKILEGSTSWKIANAIVSAKRKLMFQKSGPAAFHHVSDALLDYDSWKSEKSAASERGSGEKTGLTQRKLQRFPSVDVVICVHNALDDVVRCLHALIQNTPEDYALYIVNDGSNEETTKVLREFKVSHPETTLLENARAGGYTKAANRAMRKCKSEYVVFLNSDTIPPRLWLSNLIECGESDPSIGIVGPLSNAASWQSVPERYDDSGDWAVNELENGLNVDQMAALVYEVSEKNFPRVDFVNGFCFAIKQAVIEAIGYLDEEAFPKGYGEENDFCIRASDAGFSLAIADQGYVYHAKSKSYSHEKRRILSKKGGDALKKKHGLERIQRGVDTLKENEALKHARNHIKQYLRKGELPHRERPNPLSILYVMPVRGGGGGAHSVIQEVMGLRALGINAKVATRTIYREGFQDAYTEFFEQGDYFLFFANEEDLYKASEGFDIIVATLWSSPALIKPIAERNPHLLTAYYIQDYEPWFFDEHSDDWRGAYDSYTCVEDMCLIAKTDWLCQLVEEKHHRKVRKVSPSLDNTVYFPPSRPRDEGNVVTVCAMIRPSTPRRAPWTTLKILKEVKIANPDRVNIVTFGCRKEQLEEFRRTQAPDLELNFSFEHKGVLIREQVAELLRSADIFVDFSEYQAFGRTGLEAMACGCSVILPSKGGVDEYALNQVNALTVDTKSEKEMRDAICSLIENTDFRHGLQKNGLATAANYSIERAVLSKLSVFRLAMTERSIRLHRDREVFEISEKNPVKVAIWPCVKRLSNEPTGSAYIRLIEPLGDSSVSGKIQLSVIDSLAELEQRSADICIVQRNAIKNESTVNKLFDLCRSRQMKVVHEIDDDLFNLEENGRAVLDREEVQALKLMTAKSDAVTTSTHSLQQLLGMLNANVFCIPNAISKELWCEDRVMPNPSPQAPVRVLYMGTRSHGSDLTLLSDAWHRIEEKYGGQVTLDIVGGVAAQELKFGNPIDIPSSLGYPDFVRWLKGMGPWDIGLIPLRDTEFNRKKSAIKFLDYSALSLAIVCSNVSTYQNIAVHGENALLVSDSSNEWYEAIERLIEDRALRTRLGDTAFTGLINGHCLNNRAKDWLDTFKVVLNG